MASRSCINRDIETAFARRRVSTSGSDCDERQGPPSVRGFHLQLTPEGDRQQFLQPDADQQENERIWNELPGHSWGLTGQARAVTPSSASLRDETGEEDSTSERRNAMIVHQHAGAGQVLWIGIDSTWRWRHRVGDQYHHRFWGQIARWAASFRASRQ
ncbi:MAG: hypothetical protein R3B91_14455 [Planctomycetaceae bacterium]